MPLSRVKVAAWRAIATGAAVATLLAAGGDEGSNDKDNHREDAVTFRMPENPETKGRASRAAGWLTRHLVDVAMPEEGRHVHVIAWKDPTLEPADPQLLAGYVITDTLWAAKALKLFDPAASQDMERGLRRLGWSGNGLHDVLFHRVDKILHRSADQDRMHGHSLGRFPIDGGKTVDLRVFRQQYDARYDVGHPRLFAEHAVYHALYESWLGRVDEARARILGAIEDRRADDPGDHVFWDEKAGVLVDHVTYDDWLAFGKGERHVCRTFTFKLGVVLYAVRLLGMERELGPRLEAMKARLWDARTASGGLAHFVDVRDDGGFTTGRQPTGEASAVAILAEVVEPRRR